jgi:hypothetical protein
MVLKFEKSTQDIRGQILFLKHEDKNINIVEIKAGFARGGHYHPFETRHFLLAGKTEVREKNLDTNKETVRTITAPSIIDVPPRTAHLLIALEDTIFIEEFSNDYSATEYPEYRNKILQKTK